MHINTPLCNCCFEPVATMAKSLRPTPGCNLELSESPSGSEVDWESSSIAAIPDDLLQTVLVDKLDAPDLSRLCCVSQRWRSLGVSGFSRSELVNRCTSSCPGTRH